MYTEFLFTDIQPPCGLTPLSLLTQRRNLAATSLFRQVWYCGAMQAGFLKGDITRSSNQL